jgi:anti-anti-sigma factor
MAIKNYTVDEKTVCIAIHDRFDFSLHQEFRNAYSSYTITGVKFVVDLSQTSYMDSSALGMILLLKDYAETLAGIVELSNPQKNVDKILEIAQFHRLFTINK